MRRLANPALSPRDVGRLSVDYRFSGSNRSRSVRAEIPLNIVGRLSKYGRGSTGLESIEVAWQIGVLGIGHRRSHDVPRLNDFGNELLIIDLNGADARVVGTGVADLAVGADEG